MPKLSRPALLISTCIFLCALVMLCVTQFSAGRAMQPDTLQLAVAGIETTDGTDRTGSTGSTGSKPLASQIGVADLSSEQSEATLPLSMALSLGANASRPDRHMALMLPHPLIEGPQRPPRVARA